MVLLFFRTLAEEVKEFNADLNEKRRKDLTIGLKETLPDLFGFFYSNLERYFGSFQAQVEVSKQVKLLNAVLQTISAYIDWAPLG